MLTSIWCQHPTCFTPPALTRDLCARATTIVVGDISSNVTKANYSTDGYRDQYWDAVGFSQTPSGIVSTQHGSTTTEQTGAGTFASPLQRNGAGQNNTDRPWVDTFTFGSVSSSGLTMEYTNRFLKEALIGGGTYVGKPGEPLFGWQAINIQSISFTSNNCA
ncbi:hypothetical protein [Cutibacterium avidum]|nr:hypothetical protein [Cutibacterium avidum]ERS40800.1 hypothetical protein HMPREF1271_00423 [Propionibacterium sp. KPL1838]ERS68493.1 hypothetical protein HMPREF1279_00859 [Propionibacterium sp. KPL1852]DAU51238.1 MAG TPA: hypothetical protein [Caudoviricetes sp.]KXA68128.1 hypothetical protein HMPREF3223_00454 [Cutibacterium avidum]MCO6634275.1 hypothetical protein [Cutibacterium avidum]